MSTRVRHWCLSWTDKFSPDTSYFKFNFNIIKSMPISLSCLFLSLVPATDVHVSHIPHACYKPSRYKSEALHYGYSVATLLKPRGVATISHKYSLTVARHATVVVAVPSTVHYPTNYEIIIYYLR
jgi:hypothetical protein